jgi:preprotein translocase subunit YajC
MLDMFLAATAHAQENAEAAPAGGLDAFLSGPFLMLIAMFAIFYFILIRPQQKKAKATRQMLEALRKGDEVITNAGLVGRITGINNDQVVVEIAPQVRVKMARNSVAQLVSAPAGASSGEEKKK